MWTVCITSISHVLKLNGYGGPQAKVNEKRLGFKGWETLVTSNLKRAYAKIYHDIMNNKNKFGFTPKLVPNSFLCLLVYELGHSLSLPNS